MHTGWLGVFLGAAATGLGYGVWTYGMQYGNMTLLARILHEPQKNAAHCENRLHGNGRKDHTEEVCKEFGARTTVCEAPALPFAIQTLVHLSITENAFIEFDGFGGVGLVDCKGGLCFGSFLIRWSAPEGASNTGDHL
ncbi:MAG: hypothetical protein ACLT0O_06755 [Sutterella wadsworthensis]